MNRVEDESRRQGFAEGAHVMRIIKESIVAYTVFISYSHKDKEFITGLLTHLNNLRRQGVINAWYDGDIVAGTEWRTLITKHVNTDQIILLLISADFMNSDFCYSVEMGRAIERHNAGEARVIPILVRPTDFDGAPFAELQMLPSEAKAISLWPDRDAAFLNVVKGIRKSILDLQKLTP
jgi:TIR domain